MMQTNQKSRMMRLVLPVAILFVAGCSQLQKLAKEPPRVDVHLPTKVASQTAPTPAVDTVSKPKIITFRKQDGTQQFITPVEVDTASGEKIMSVAIDEVVISAGSLRNLVERNGKINMDYIVSVPKSLQHTNWRLIVDPLLAKGPDTLTLAPLVYSGSDFRAMQEREYARYDSYLSRIVDSAAFFDQFGDKRAFQRYLNQLAAAQSHYAAMHKRLLELTPQQALTDRLAGWQTPAERKRQYDLMRQYVRNADRDVRRHATCKTDTTSRFAPLEDFLRPRYRYQGVEVLPGGEVYTRVNDRYPSGSDRARENYINRLTYQPTQVRKEVKKAAVNRLPELVRERIEYTGLRYETANGWIRETSDSATQENYRIQRDYTADMAAHLAGVDPDEVKLQMLRQSLVDRNRERMERTPEAYKQLVRHPYLGNARLDTVIYRPDGRIDYFCTDEIDADENTSKLYLFLAANVEDRDGRNLSLTHSDTLIYNVASMTTFVDEHTRYMQRIILRDAEANARFYFIFPSNRSTLDDQLPENRRQIAAVKDLTRRLMTDPIFIIDSITLHATASPEGRYARNERLARERADELKQVLTSEFRTLYDSLKVAASYTLDNQGRQVLVEEEQNLPNLPQLLRSTYDAEDWDQLLRLVQTDTTLTINDKEGFKALIDEYSNPDTREAKLRSRYPSAYAYMRRTLYPQMRAVDFRFNLHRRGMQQDTVYTTEVDSTYMHAVELLKKRHYEKALTILRPYEDRNTALAYLSLGYDVAAYGILKRLPDAHDNADTQYLLAIEAARLGDEEQAVQYFLRAVELRENLKFRGNLDPELSRLIRKYGLFKEDFQ